MFLLFHMSIIDAQLDRTFSDVIEKNEFGVLMQITVHINLFEGILNQIPSHSIKIWKPPTVFVNFVKIKIFFFVLVLLLFCNHRLVRWHGGFVQFSLIHYGLVYFGLVQWRIMVIIIYCWIYVCINAFKQIQRFFSNFRFDSVRTNTFRIVITMTD